MNLFLATVVSSSLFLMSVVLPPKADIHAEYASRTGVTAFSFNKELIDALDFDFDVNDTRKYVSGDLHAIKFLSFGSDYEESTKELLKDLKQRGYDKIEWTNDEKGEELLLFVERNGKKFSEIHFVNLKGENPRTLISFYGDITVKDHK